ncbi:peptidoglycan-binding domain-containing protein [Xylanimonas cellulosilytica]|nr:peptidoglycan-binding domain-containing protein [Xylanimonas cellulosilytica]
MVSPEQVAAQAEPPPPTPVVAALREGYLHGTMTMTATAVSSGVHEVVAPKALDGVVTFSDFAVAGEVQAGSAVVRVNGRPVIVMAGPFPLYRDLTSGDTGDDVLMLQRALVDAGHLRGTPDGVFGARTAAAVRALYRTVGFPAPTTAVAPEPAVAASSATADGEPLVAPVRPATMVRAAELVFTGALPAQVGSVVPVGATVEPGTVLASLTVGATELRADVPPEAIGPLAVGAAATFVGDGGAAGLAQVESITPGQDGQMQVHWSLEGAVAVGTDYVLTVENPAAQDAPTLLAPIAALVSRGGVDTVTVREDDVFREVAVEVLGMQGAVAAIRAQDDAGVLRAGSEVRLV